MKKAIVVLAILMILPISVSAMDISPPSVPDFAYDFMPDDPHTLHQGLAQVIQRAILYFHPDLRSAAVSSMGVIAIVLLTSILQSASETSKYSVLAGGTVAVGLILLERTNSLIQLGLQTVSEISEYGKLFFPVLATAMAAQGKPTASAQLYAVTVAFNTILTTLITGIIRPLLYVYLLFAIASGVIQDKLLQRIQERIKALSYWALKAVLYIFTGFLSLTGVISGAADALALKATRMAISGAVPVVGGILSEASEAVVLGAATILHSAGLYGFFAIIAIGIRPFLKIAAQYIVLKCTTELCTVLSKDALSECIGTFSDAMGILLAVTGTLCLVLMISLVCFMKGVG